MSECQMCHCEDATILEFCDDCYTEMKAESDQADKPFLVYWEISEDEQNGLRT